ncbi:MAG: hypothetical protein J6V54_05615 [Bacteroidales bacterium]|nr:hypothetical protein [Bacteroidales bacterium]
MKDWIKKHKLIIIIGAIIIIFSWPLIVNCLYNVETDCEVLHKPQEWTIFWGSYIGSIISAAVAFIILFLQRKDNRAENEINRKENEKNRILQLKILEQQQEMQWLNTFRQACIEYISVCSVRNIREIVYMVKSEPKEAYYLMKTKADEIEKSTLMIKMLWNKKDNNNILKTITEDHNLCVKTANDMFCVIDFFIKHQYEYFLSELISSQIYQSKASENLKEIVQREKNDEQLKNNGAVGLSSREDDQKILFKIVLERFQKYQDDNEHNNIKTLLFGYIKEQERRINAITNI